MRVGFRIAFFKAEAKTILTKLGITEFDKDIHTLSGGQKKRVALAKTLVEPAEVLILDDQENNGHALPSAARP